MRSYNVKNNIFGLYYNIYGLGPEIHFWNDRGEMANLKKKINFKNAKNIFIILN